jgi:hypothetical protein
LIKLYMSLLPILRFPDPRLKKVAARVEAIDDGIRRLAANMAETMYEAQGSAQRVTRLSHAVRGIEALPQRHRGPQRPQEGRERETGWPDAAAPASTVGLAFEIASGKRLQPGVFLCIAHQWNRPPHAPSIGM